jgi:hypothetical protein
MTPEQHLERASAELAAGDFASANTHALIGIGWLLAAQAPKSVQLTLCPSCQFVAFADPEGAR